MDLITTSFLPSRYRAQFEPSANLLDGDSPDNFVNNFAGFPSKLTFDRLYLKLHFIQ
jgi:hypothetical protein